MFREAINGLLAIRDIDVDGDNNVYISLCRSISRYMELSYGLALKDYVDVTNTIDTLPETDIKLFQIDDDLVSYGYWFKCVASAVELIVQPNEYGVYSKDLSALWRQFLSTGYWERIYKVPYEGVEDIHKFTMDHYLAPYVSRKNHMILYAEPPDVMSVCIADRPGIADNCK